MRRIALSCGMLLALFALAGVASAADSLAAGKIKSVNAENKAFVLTDANGRDFNFKLSDETTITRDSAESQANLAAGDRVHILYDKGLLTWTAKYIQVREGDSKNFELAFGKVKSYDGKKLNFTFTDDEGRDFTHSSAFVRVWVNDDEVAFDDLKIGDSVLLVMSRDGAKTELKWVRCER